MWLAAIAAALPFIPLPTPHASVLLNPMDDAPVQEAPATAAAPTEPEDACTADASGERVKPKLVTTEMVNAARDFLDYPLGTECVRQVGGRRYVFVLEWHYHPPGFEGGPTGWHKGVTVYELR